MRPAGTVVTLDSGKRYTVFMRDDRPARVSVWMAGAYNRAGYWRGIDPWGRAGKLAVAAAKSSTPNVSGLSHTGGDRG